MNIKQYIRLCALKRGLTLAKIAERLGTSKQNLGAKLTNNHVRVDYLEKIAAALDADVDVRFIDRATGEPII